MIIARRKNLDYGLCEIILFKVEHNYDPSHDVSARLEVINVYILREGTSFIQKNVERVSTMNFMNEILPGNSVSKLELYRLFSAFYMNPIGEYIYIMFASKIEKMIEIQCNPATQI